jgi:hypothetical protein
MLRYRSIASLVAQSHNARVVLLYAYEGVRDGGREEYLSRRAAALSGFGVELEPLEEPVRTEHGKRSFEQILATCEKKRCDLIVIPAPYLDDYVKLGQESVGAHLDMLPCRAASALLVVREPQADPQRCLANLLLPVAPYEATTVQAAGWALKLLSQNACSACLRLQRLLPPIARMPCSCSRLCQILDPSRRCGLRRWYEPREIRCWW